MDTDTQRLIDKTPSPSTKAKCEPMFEEEWCRVYPDELEITWYYFPTAGSKRINTDLITGIYYGKQDLCASFGKIKSWGMAFSPSWWACDMKRFLRKGGEHGYYNVVVDIGDGIMKGFTTANLPELLAVLRRVCRNLKICEEGFPF